MHIPKAGEIWRAKKLFNSECIIVSGDAVTSDNLTTVIYQHIEGSKLIVADYSNFVDDFEFTRPAKEPSLIEEILNLLLSGYQWYRALKGGNWYLVEVIDFSLGSTFMWVQRLPDLRDVDYRVRDVEENN